MSAKNIIFIVWIVIILFPLFSEMELLGVKFKKEIEKAKEDTKKEIKEYILQTTISQSVQANPNIYVGYPPLSTEKELEELKLETEKLPKSSPNTNTNFEVTKQSIELFKARLSIETAIRSLCEKVDIVVPSFQQMINHLLHSEIIEGNISGIIREILAITNRGVHGEIVSDEYYDFVMKALPSVLTELKSIENKLKYVTCPKCRYGGYSAYENVCPKCGNICCE